MKKDKIRGGFFDKKPKRVDEEPETPPVDPVYVISVIFNDELFTIEHSRPFLTLNEAKDLWKPGKTEHLYVVEKDRLQTMDWNHIVLTGDRVFTQNYIRYEE